MKKYFILAAAALVALAACSKVETDETPAKKISFAPATYVASTKADTDPSTKHSLASENINAFSSKAYLHAAGVTGAQDMFGTSGETVSWISSSSTWEPANEYFWPKAASSYINFVSWYGSNSKNPTVTETTMTWGSTGSPLTIVADDNFLFADEAWHYKQNTSNGEQFDSDPTTSGVVTLFHHALAKLAFNIRLATNTPSTKTVWDVEVKTVTLTVGNNGYLNLVNSENTTTNSTRAYRLGTTYSESDATLATSNNVGWARPSSPTSETIVETGNSTSGVTAAFTKPTMRLSPTTATSSTPNNSGNFVEFLAERTVMPQVVNGGAVNFGMTFTIKMYHRNPTTEAVESTPFSTEDVTIDSQSLYTLVNTIGAWNMNTKVTYNITIDPVNEKIVFDPAVVDWATTDNGATGTQVYPTTPVTP